MNSFRTKLILMTGAALLISGCNFGAPAGTSETPTLSSDDVMRTAEAMVEATRQSSSPTPTINPVTLTPTQPPASATPTITSTPSAPIVVADYNANVRSGPDEVFGVVDFLLQGDQANAEGRFIHDDGGVWYYITREGQGLPGWIWGGAVTVAGDPDSIPFLESPPTPTPGPSPTESPTP